MKHKKIGLKEALGNDGDFLKFLAQEASPDKYETSKKYDNCVCYCRPIREFNFKNFQSILQPPIEEQPAVDSDYTEKKESRKKGHPTPQMLYDYVLGLLDKKDAMKIQKHFSICGVCADEALRIMRIEDELTAKSVDWANKILWRTFSWKPQWAGVFVTASEIPEQRHSFKIDEGEINLSCYWKPNFGNDPAYIHLSWNAKNTISARLWVRFVNSETQEVFSEICLGTHLQGEDNFTSDRLGFDPSNEKWAVSIIFEEIVR